MIDCDASSHGVGAVLSTRQGGVESPLAFASRTRAPAEPNYSQLEREAHAIILVSHASETIFCAVVLC